MAKKAKKAKKTTKTKTAKSKKTKTTKKVTKKATAKKVAKKATQKIGKKTTQKAKAARKAAPKKATAEKAATEKAEVFASKVKVGEMVPDFELPMTGGKTFKLSEAKGKIVVLYFYPKDATPGCTIEGQDFTRLHGDFKSAGAEVLGLSRDNMRSHESFKAKQAYTIDLLSDENEKACSVFGAIKMKNMYGKQVRGIDRSTFVIDRDGKLLREWRSVNVPGHAEEVLDFVRSQK